MKRKTLFCMMATLLLGIQCVMAQPPICEVEISTIYGSGGARGTAPGNAALVSVETLANGDFTITLNPVNNNNPRFRGDGITGGTFTNITVDGVANTGNALLTRSWASNVLTIHPESAIADGTPIVFNNVCFEYETDVQGGLWPDLTFTYAYGTTCAGLPKVTTTPESINFTPTQGEQTFTLTGENLVGSLTLTAAKGLKVTPTTIAAEADGTIALANQTVTVTWEEGSTSGGSVNISGGGLTSDRKINVTSLGFSEFCNTVISQENNGASNLAYVTVATSEDKTQVILSIEPYDTDASATANWKGFGNVFVNEVTTTPAISYNEDKTVGTMTFPTALSNGDVIRFGNAIVWELTGTLWNNDNCFMNAYKTYTVGLGCDIAQEDSEAPEVESAALVSKTSYNAVISVNATDNEGVTQIRFKDAANGIDVTQTAKSDNGTANYTINNLQGNTAYSIVVTALDLIGNETAIANAKTVAFITLHTPEITAVPNSLEFIPTAGTKTFSLSGAYVTEEIQLTAPAGYTVTPSTITPEVNGTIPATIVNVKWLNGLGNGIVLSGGGLKDPVKLVDLTYSGAFSEYCSYVIGTNNPALLNIGINEEKTVLTYTIAAYDITGDATWNGNSLAASVILVNESAPTTAPTRVAIDSHTITITFAEALNDNDIISYASGTTLVWTTAGYTNYGNGTNNFIDNWGENHTVSALNCECQEINKVAECSWNPDAVSTDWNDPANWKVGDAAANAIPSENAVVTIPGGATMYPILKSTTPVNSITFEPGAELGNQHLLTHSSAIVKYGLNAGRYYMLSNPFSGNMLLKDFYLNKQPSIYAHNYSVRESKADYPEFFWDPITKTSAPLPPGEGFLFKLGTGFGDSKVITVPYEDATYTYTLNGGASITKPVAFGYGGDGYSDNTKYAFIGNPFITTIDFKALVRENTILSGNYLIMKGQFSYTGYTEIGPWGNIEDYYDVVDPDPKGENSNVINITSDDYQYIAPLQALVVESVDATVGVENIVFDIAEVLPANNTQGVELRSVVNPTNKLNIIASNDEAAVLTFIANNENGRDARKLFTNVDGAIINTTPDIYTLKAMSDGKTAALGANIINTHEALIPLALATDYSGDITFSFSGMDTYDANILFIDTEENQTINLTGKESDKYVFTYTGNSESANENRFLLEFTPRKATSVNETLSQNLLVYGKDNIVHVISSSSDLIKQVYIYNMQGQLLNVCDDVNALTYASPSLNTSEFYVIKIITENSSKNVKILM